MHSMVGTTLKRLAIFDPNSVNQANYFGGIFQTDPLPPLTSGTKTEQCSLYVPISGGGRVEDIRGRSRGAGVDYAVCRNDRGLGAADSPALTPHPALCAGRAGLGEKRDGGCNCVPPTWTPRARGITIEGRVGPTGRSRPLKPQ